MTLNIHLVISFHNVPSIIVSIQKHWTYGLGRSWATLAICGMSLTPSSLHCLAPPKYCAHKMLSIFLMHIAYISHLRGLLFIVHMKHVLVVMFDWIKTYQRYVALYIENLHNELNPAPLFLMNAPHCVQEPLLLVCPYMQECLCIGNFFFWSHAIGYLLENYG